MKNRDGHRAPDPGRPRSFPVDSRDNKYHRFQICRSYHDYNREGLQGDRSSVSEEQTQEPRELDEVLRELDDDIDDERWRGRD